MEFLNDYRFLIKKHKRLLKKPIWIKHIILLKNKKYYIYIFVWSYQYKQDISISIWYQYFFLFISNISSNDKIQQIYSMILGSVELVNVSKMMDTWDCYSNNLL